MYSIYSFEMLVEKNGQKLEMVMFTSPIYGKKNTVSNFSQPKKSM